MLPIQTALLYVGPPDFDAQKIGPELLTRLAGANHPAQEICPSPGDVVALRTDRLHIHVSLSLDPLPTDSFAGAMDSPLCRQVTGALTDTLSRHTAHLRITLTAPEGGDHTSPIEHLELAHLVTTFFAQMAPPAAVLWRQSNLLLTRAQYLGLAKQARPWILFAKLRETAVFSAESQKDLRGITVENAVDFIGAPIELRPTDISRDAACAAVLSLLGHAAQSATPLGGGQIVKSENGIRFQLLRLAPTPKTPNGIYQLSVAPFAAETAPGDPARLPGATFNSPEEEISMPDPDPTTPSPALPDDQQSFDRQQSLVLSYVMLAILPPLGAVLMILNLIFGANAWRTGFVAAVSVAALLSLSAYVFLNAGNDTLATIDAPAPVEAIALQE